MIISNCTDNPELVKRSIVSLGDSLAIRNDVFGSQFCYLLVDPKFSEYNDLPNNLSNSPNSGKIILVGASHKRPFKEFASNEAIIITEIYEYARSLNNEKFVLPEFQVIVTMNILKYIKKFSFRNINLFWQTTCWTRECN